MSLSPKRERSADRRSGAAAPVGGPVTQARRRLRAPCVPRGPACAVRASGGRSPLGAPPRRFFGPEPALARPLSVAQSGALRLRLAHSRVPLVVAEGRCCRAPPGGRGDEPDAQDAASRSDSGSSPETPSTNGTRHGGTDRSAVNERLRLSIKLCAARMCSADRRAFSRRTYAQANWGMSIAPDETQTRFVVTTFLIRWQRAKFRR